MDDKKIVIQGKEIYYGMLSDEEILSLYNQLLNRQALIEQKIKENRGV